MAKGFRRPPKDPRGGHARIYWELLDSPAWSALGYSTQALYVILRRKLTATNNGNISATLGELEPYGWGSQTTLAKALRELIAAGFIAITRQGGIAYGQGICTLYRFTDEQVFEFPKLHIEARKATNEWAELDTIDKAKAAIKNELGLQILERHAPDSGASNRFYAPESGEVATPLLQNLEQSQQAESAAKPRQHCVSGVSALPDTKNPTTPESGHLYITATPTAETAAVDNALPVVIAEPKTARAALKKKRAAREKSEAAPAVVAGEAVGESGGAAGDLAGAGKPAGGKRGPPSSWTPERLADLRAYREANGLGAAAAHFGINRQRVCKLLPGMGKPRGRGAKVGRAAGAGSAGGD